MPNDDGQLWVVARRHEQDRQCAGPVHDRPLRDAEFIEHATEHVRVAADLTVPRGKDQNVLVTTLDPGQERERERERPTSGTACPVRRLDDDEVFVRVTIAVRAGGGDTCCLGRGLEIDGD